MPKSGRLRGLCGHAVLAAHSVRHYLAQLLFERRLNLDTSGAVSLEKLGIDAEDRLDYEPSSWRSLRTGLRGLNVSDEDVFVDLGSGKGRVVAQAAEKPFKRVIGVELSAELNRIARANLEANRWRMACQEIELVTADLACYDIPDEVTIAYCANSVRGELFGALATKLLESLDRRPRRLSLIYNNPKEHDALLATGRARVRRDYAAGFYRQYPMRVYELLPKLDPPFRSDADRADR